MMKLSFTGILFLSCAYHCIGQIDSSYIRMDEDQVAIKTFLSKNFIFLDQETSNRVNYSYLPNNAPNIGFGLSVNNTIIDFSYGYGFDFLRNKKRGKTDALDFQLHNYGRKFVVDLFIQQYKGFYLNNEDEDKMLLYPDLQIRQYGIYGQYVFNNKRFSYRAAFVQNEKQLKSAGSFLLGGGIYHTKIHSGGSFSHNEKNTFRSFQFGFSAGYAYTWVLGTKWFISASATTGINFGSEKFKDFGKYRIKISPTIFPRISAGYSRKSWSLSGAYVGNMVFPEFAEDSNIGLNSGSLQLTLIKRLSLSFLQEKEKPIKIPSILMRER